MVSKIVFSILLFIKVVLLAAFIMLDLMDLKQGVSPGWAFQKVFLMFIVLPLFVLLSLAEVTALADQVWPVKYLPVWVLLLCAVAILVEGSYTFEINIFLLSIALLLTVLEGVYFFRAH